MEKSICDVCNTSIIVSVTSEEAGKDLKGLDLITGSMRRNRKSAVCNICSRREYEAKEAKLVPKRARQLVKKIHPTYRCPICENKSNTKSGLLLHITTLHDSFRIEEALGIRHT